ncbi:MAG: AAA family ATPase, partial [bacterium]|nr:AAA family ATPase [bacterium]
TYNRLITGMALRGEWKPFFDYITGRMRESMSLRDLITGEKSIQAFLNVYLALTRLYIVHCEKEFNQGYADIFMRPFTTHYKAIKYAYMIEVKYIKKGDKTKSRKSLIKQAEEQLKSYSLDQKLKNSLPGVTLIKLVLVFTGNELTYFESV